MNRGSAVAPAYGALMPSMEKSRPAALPPPPPISITSSGAAGGYRRGNGLAPPEHHVRAVPRRLHPHAPRTFLALASDRDILGNGARRPAMPHEVRMVETVAASHIVGVLLSKRLELGAIGMAQAGCGGAEQQCEPKAD
jgi:hypothetical protein